MAGERLYQSSGPIAIPTIGKTEALSPATGKSISLEKAVLLNSSGGAANVGLGFNNPNEIWNAGQWDASETGTEYVDDTTDAQDAGTDDFALSAADGDGFVVQSETKFNLARITISQAGVGGTVATPTIEYYTGSWVALPTITVPNFAATGDSYLVFMTPADWIKGGGTGITGYAVRITFAATAPTTPALAAQLSVVSLLDYYEALGDGESVTFSLSGELYIPYGASLVPYFSVANAANMAEFIFRPAG